MASDLSLDEFLGRLPVLAEAFKASTLEHGRTDDTFNQRREEVDWFYEMAAWSAIGDIQEPTNGE